MENSINFLYIFCILICIGSCKRQDNLRQFKVGEICVNADIPSEYNCCIYESQPFRFQGVIYLNPLDRGSTKFKFSKLIIDSSGLDLNSTTPFIIDTLFMKGLKLGNERAGLWGDFYGSGKDYYYMASGSEDKKSFQLVRYLRNGGYYFTLEIDESLPQFPDSNYMLPIIKESKRIAESMRFCD